MAYTTEVFDSSIKEMCNDIEGPVQRDLRARATRVLDRARALAPIETGRLKASLRLNRKMGIGGLYSYEVGSTVGYAIMVHEGTRPHLIHPNLQRTLRFKEGGRTIYATVVHHPGTRPHRFLTEALATEGIG